MLYKLSLDVLDLSVDAVSVGACTLCVEYAWEHAGRTKKNIAFNKAPQQK
jgi:hypothetical protein